MQIDESLVKWDRTAPHPAGSGIPSDKVVWESPGLTPTPRATISVDNTSPSVTEVNASTGQPDHAASLGQRIARRSKDVGRQAGLTARYGIEGLGQAAELVTEPIRQMVTNPAARALDIPEGKPLGQAMSSFADNIGLPKPMNDTERVVGDATRLMAGGGGMAGAAGKVAQATAGPIQTAAKLLSSNPGAQIIGAAGTGAGAGASRASGGNEFAQLASGVAGGLTAGGMVQAARAGLQSASVLVPLRAQRVEQQIDQALSGAGVNWKDVPEAIKQSMRKDAEAALRSGKSLDSTSLSRLLDFQRVGALPTRGTLTLDPIQITREQNLSKIGANSNDSGLHGLAKVQNENNNALIGTINRLGAGRSDDAHSVGERAISALQGGIKREKQSIDHLYEQARDSAGRSFPLNGNEFTSKANRLLDDALLGGALPSSVSQHLNRIALGEVPFDIAYAEQLKTAIGKLQRASGDGQARMALGLVRQALDDTPIMELGKSGLAGGPTTASANPLYAGGTQIGEQALDAFNRARLANRTMMERVDRIPGLKAVYEGTATPDDFVQRYVINRSAKTVDTGNLAEELRRNDPDTLEAVRASLAAHLKSAAIGNASDETARFSAAGFNRAMLALGQRKLQQFFSSEEIAQLKAAGKVSQYTSAQPVGSAVNNSNSGALLMGRGLDLIDRLAAKVPLLGLGPTISGVTRNMQQHSAQSIGPALLQRTKQKASRLPGVTFGTLIAAEEQQ